MTASAASGQRIEIGVKILPPLPEHSRIRIGVVAGEYQFEFHPSAGHRLVRWLPIGFLLFWLYGWAQGETFTLKQVFDPTTPAGVKIFLGIWIAGWTVGGMIALAFSVALAFRPGAEKILLQRNQLLWQPAYPLLQRFRQRPKAFLEQLRSIHRRTIALSREQIQNISIITQYDNEDHTPVDHLVLQCDNKRYELGTELTEDDLVWLCAALNTWKRTYG
jgi:hypothetical protein